MQSRRAPAINSSKPLRVGFVPLCDSAPLVMAQELGLFEKHGVRVHLSREVGWATVRDKILYRELDAAHALAPMVFAASLGLGSGQADCLTGLVLGLNGNAITLAQTLWDEGVRDGNSLRQRTRRRGEPLTFGIPFPYSSHHFLLRAWLRSNGFVPERDARFVVVPPPQMPTNLKAGHLDGYCVGEPWNAVATLAGFGWRAATSAEIAPQHPEKVLMVRRTFAESRAEEHVRLIGALLEACRFCNAPENRDRIVETLGGSQFVNAPSTALRAGCEFTLAQVDPSDDDGIPDRHPNEPSAARAAWVLDHLKESGLLSGEDLPDPDIASNIFRADIFHQATQLDHQNETLPLEV